MPLCYIALGSNLGNRYENVQRAMDEIQHTPGIELKQVSYFYETQAEGMGPGAPDFYNGAVEIETDLPPADLLQRLLQIEERLGRVRPVDRRYTSRTIDLDLLMYGDGIVHEPGLEVPHPRMTERWFVLKPLADICPSQIIPGHSLTVLEALLKLEATQDPSSSPS